MIFLVKYRNNVEALFFHIWDAQQHVNFFDTKEQEEMEIVRINEQDVEELKGLEKILQNYKETNNDHCCGNCGRTFWDKGVLLCRFLKEETNPNDYCTHYI